MINNKRTKGSYKQQMEKTRKRQSGR